MALSQNFCSHIYCLATLTVKLNCGFRIRKLHNTWKILNLLRNRSCSCLYEPQRQLGQSQLATADAEAQMRELTRHN